MAVQLRERLTEAPGLPARLGLPVVLSPEHFDVVQIAAWSGEATAEKRRHGLDRQRGVTVVPQADRATQHPYVGKAPVGDRCREFGHRVKQRNLQQAPRSVFPDVVADVTHPAADHGLRVALSRPLPATSGEQHIEQRQAGYAAMNPSRRLRRDLRFEPRVNLCGR